jgi:hypothetical protein
MRELYDYLLRRCVEACVAWYPRARFDGEDSLRRHGISVGFIVNADGVRSRVARELGLDENRKCILGLEDVFVSASTAGPPACHCWFGAGERFATPVCEFCYQLVNTFRWIHWIFMPRILIPFHATTNSNVATTLLNKTQAARGRRRSGRRNR